MKIKILATLIVSALILGCGYTTRSAIFSGTKNIYIAQFKNKIDFTSDYNEYKKLRTYFPLLEVSITNEVIDKFLSDGNLRISKEENADFILTGELLEYRRDALRYDDDQDVDEYRINLVVSLSFWNSEENKQQWVETRFVGDTTYFTTGSLAKSEQTAVNDAVRDLAKRIVERVVDDW